MVATRAHDLAERVCAALNSHRLGSFEADFLRKITEDNFAAGKKRLSFSKHKENLSQWTSERENLNIA
jgi:hypothetical protein